MRVYDLAWSLDRPWREVIEILRADGHWVRSHLSTVPKIVVDRVFEQFPRVNEGARPSQGWQPLPVDRDGGETAEAAALLWRRLAGRRRPGPAPITYRKRVRDLDDDDLVPVFRYTERLTTRDVAQLLGVSQATVRKWVSRGHIAPVATEGSANVFDTEAVLAAFDQLERRRRATGGSSITATFKPVIDVPIWLQERLITVAEAAKLVDASEATVRAWIHRGHLKRHPSSTSQRSWLLVRDVITAASNRRVNVRESQLRRGQF